MHECLSVALYIGCTRLHAAVPLPAYLQATLGEPVKRNAYKGIALCYSVISIGYLLVTITGYWVRPWSCMPCMLLPSQASVDALLLFLRW